MARKTDAETIVEQLPRLAPTETFVAVTPHDENNLATPSHRGLWVGTGGNLAAVRLDDTVVDILNVPNGAFLPIVVKRVNATDTTADDIVALS